MNCKQIHSIDHHISILILVFITREGDKLVVWDVQAGVIIRVINAGRCDKILFHGDQRIITLVQMDEDFYIYDALNNTQLFRESGFGTHWAYEDTLQFATSSETDGKLMINIYELQKTSNPPFQTLSSFPIPPYEGTFSFSPVSFHASFITKTRVAILGIQDSKILLDTKVAQSDPLSGQFSPDGCFFACEMLENEISIWQNTPTGYVSLSILRPRLSFWGFSWSPTSISILCWGTEGIQLLHPKNYSSPLPPGEDEPDSQQGGHLVSYSTDWVHIAIAQQGDSIVTVLDYLSGTIKCAINTEMEIQELKIIDNTVFVADVHKLASWNLEEDGIIQRACETLAISASAEHLTLSHDCSQIAFRWGGQVSLYDIKTQKIIKSVKCDPPSDIRLSPDGYQLWVTAFGGPYGGPFSHYLVKLEVMEDWRFVHVTRENLENEWSWIDLFSSYGFHVRLGSGWVVDSRDRKVLWLPPHWRVKDCEEVRWEDNLLAFVGSHHPVPIIIEFQL